MGFCFFAIDVVCASDGPRPNDHMCWSFLTRCFPIFLSAVVSGLFSHFDESAFGYPCCRRSSSAFHVGYSSVCFAFRFLSAVVLSSLVFVFRRGRLPYPGCSDTIRERGASRRGSARLARVLGLWGIILVSDVYDSPLCLRWSCQQGVYHPSNTVVYLMEGNACLCLGVVCAGVVVPIYTLFARSFFLGRQA